MYILAPWVFRNKQSFIPNFKKAWLYNDHSSIQLVFFWVNCLVLVAILHTAYETISDRCLGISYDSTDRTTCGFGFLYYSAK